MRSNCDGFGLAIIGRGDLLARIVAELFLDLAAVVKLRLTLDNDMVADREARGDGRAAAVGAE